jgi:hypothetical protein
MTVKRRSSVTRIIDNKSVGHSKTAGKWHIADGLVARSGRRRVSNDPSPHDKYRVELLHELAADLSAQVLRGRRLEVFRAVVLDPRRAVVLDPRVPDKSAAIRALAAKHGVTVTRIRKDLDRAVGQLKKAVRSDKYATRAKLSHDKQKTGG